MELNTFLYSKPGVASNDFLFHITIILELNFQ